MESVERKIEFEATRRWKEQMHRGIIDALDNFDTLFYPEEGQDFYTPLNFSPMTYAASRDERMWYELSPKEQDFIRKQFFKQIGFNAKTAKEIASYSIEAPEGAMWEGTATVKVFETERSEHENMYLHALHHPDGNEEYTVAPPDYRF